MLKHTQELLNGQPSGPNDAYWFSRRLKAAYKLAASRMPAAVLTNPNQPSDKARRAHAIWSKALNHKINMNIANGAIWFPGRSVEKLKALGKNVHLLYLDPANLRMLVVVR